MAKQREQLSLDADVFCSLCYDFLSDPFSLTCFHSFCERCVRKIERVKPKKGSSQIGVHCPLCREFCPQNSIKANFVMRNLIEAYARKAKLNEGLSGSNRCIQCESNAITSFCLNCQVNLCRKCKMGHCRLPNCKDHQVVPLNEKDTHGRVVINMFCDVHSGQEIKLCCRQCFKAICYECKVEAHDTHKTESVKFALERLLPYVKDQLQQIKLQRVDIKRELSKIEEILLKTKANKEMIKQHILEEQQRKIDKIKYDTKKLLDQIDVFGVAERKELKMSKDNLEYKLSSQNSLISWGETVTESVEGPGLLHELLDGLIQVLKSHTAEKLRGNNQLSSRNEIMQHKFFPTVVRGECNIIGSLVTEQIHISYSEPYMGKALLSQYHEPMEISNSFRETDIMLENLSNDRFKFISKFKLHRAADRMCFFRGKLWAPSSTGGLIDIYDESGKLCRTISTLQGMWVRDIHPLNSDYLVVASNEKLIVIDSRGNLISVIKHGKFRSVHIKHDLIAVLHSVSEKKSLNKKIVTLIKCSNFEIVKEFKVDKDARQLLLQDSSVYVMTTTEGDPPLIKYSLQGKELCKSGKWTESKQQTPGNLNMPRLSVCDTYGSVLVSEINNNRIQVLNKEGVWKIVFKKQSVFFDDVFVREDGIMYVLNASWYIERFKIDISCGESTGN